MPRAMFESVYKESFPFWGGISEDEREFICRHSVAVTYNKGETIHDGTECSGVFFVRSGCLRVYIMSEDGKAVTLYRLYAGDMCMLASSCVLQAVTFDVFIDVEEDSECFVVNGNAFASVSENNPDVKIFALELAVTRFSDVMWVMQQILFMSMDKRLAIFLLEETQANGADSVNMTHETIARHLGTAREVVTRMLKHFAADGVIEVTRKGILIADKKKLRSIAY